MFKGGISEITYKYIESNFFGGDMLFVYFPDVVELALLGLDDISFSQGCMYYTHSVRIV